MKGWAALRLIPCVKQRKVDMRINVDLATLPVLLVSCAGLGFRLVVGASLVPMDVSVSFHLFWVLCTGQQTLGIRGITGSLIWRFSLSNGLVSVCSARRSLVSMFVHNALFLFLPEGIGIRQGCRSISGLV